MLQDVTARFIEVGLTVLRIPHVVTAHSLEPLRTARALAESTLGAPPPDYSI